MQKFWWKIASAQQAGQKTRQASQLNTLATDSSDIPLRSPTRTSYIHMPFEFVPLTSTRLARDKTHQASWPFAGPQKASVLNREETTKSNAYMCSPRHRERQGRCNGHELQLRIGILCGFNPFGFPAADHKGSFYYSHLDGICGQ